MVTEERNMKTRDGIELYSAVIRPDAKGKFPIVLLRNPYAMHYSDKLTPENYRALNGLDGVYDHWDELVQAGFVLVVQHTRGTGNSKGEWGSDDGIRKYWTSHDDEDGEDTMKWLRQQDFYDGSIFRWGGSYLSVTGMMDVYRDYPDLKGLVMVVPVPGLYNLSAKNGFFSTGMMGQTSVSFASWLGKMGSAVNHTMDSWRAFPQKDWCQQIFGWDNPMITEYQQHPRQDDPFWREQGLGHTLYQSWETLKVPVLLMTAWYDHSIGTNLQMWNRIPEETRKKSTMFITPFSHSLFNGNEKAWPLKMSGSTKDAIAPYYVQNWFSYILGKEDLKGLQLNKVTYFPECGQNVWFVDQDRLQDGEEFHTVYLNADRKLGKMPGETSEVTYLYNPYNPATFYGGCGDIESGYMRPGTESFYGAPNANYMESNFHSICMTPQDSPNFRYDVISFEGSPVEKTTYFKGASEADVYVKSDCEDTCFYARLYVVKDDVAYGVRQDIISLSYQLGDYVPGTEVKVHFHFHPIVWRLEPGDSLRLDITSSSYPNYSVHTNVKAPLQCDVEKPICAHNTIVYGKSSFTFHTSSLSPETTERIVVGKE
jgi:putative CocE/NonD family hydrolase